MIKKIWSGKIRWAVIISCTFFFMLVFYWSLRVLIPNSFRFPSYLSVSSASEQKKTDSSMPTRLRIPKINVDASVEYLGLTPLGAMDVPASPTTVGWFDQGRPTPGEIGTAVIDGHSGWKNNIPAVFDDLYKLKKGDKVYVENGKGIVTVFAVRETKTYDQNASVPSVFFSSDGIAHLNLITCSGVWSESTKSSSSRLIVFMDKVI